uniref:Uncharacterized protein n=1 Tax=Arundo donax TaxID=35708 RepID=A0A0A8ZPV1_ARUDO
MHMHMLLFPTPFLSSLAVLVTLKNSTVIRNAAQINYFGANLLH